MFNFTSDQVIEVEAQHRRKSVEVIACEVGLVSDDVSELLEVVRILPDMRAERAPKTVARGRALRENWVRLAYELMAGSL